MNNTIENFTQKEQIQTFLSAFPSEFINLTDIEQKISIQIYNQLAKGQPISVKNIADLSNLPSEKVKAIIDNWPGVFYNEKNDIIGYWGITINKMGHRFKVNGSAVYTWCAWDALFIPQILQKTAEILSTDPVTGDEIQITVSPKGIVNLDPAGSVISFMIPTTEKIRSDVVNSFCHYLHFFGSRETANEWISQNEKKNELVILSLQEAYDIGRQKNEMQYKELIQKN